MRGMEQQMPTHDKRTRAMEEQIRDMEEQLTKNDRRVVIMEGQMRDMKNQMSRYKKTSESNSSTNEGYGRTAG